MTALTLLLTLVGFAILGVSSEPHRRRWPGRHVAVRGKGPLHAMAWIALALAFGASVAARGWAVGPVLWAGLVMLGAGVVFLMLNVALPPRKR